MYLYGLSLSLLLLFLLPSQCLPLPFPPTVLLFFSLIHTHIGDCYTSSDHGQSYTGQLATTQKEERCQSWDKPHLLFHPDLYSELDGATNLCRNPGQQKDRIWCFTSESAWNYCPIPTNCSKCTYV